MKILVFQYDNQIDLITNSSSELFTVPCQNKSKEFFVNLINSFIPENYEYKVKSQELHERIFQYEDEWSAVNTLEILLKNFPEEDREEIRQKYFNKPNYFAISFDRDWVFLEEDIVKAALYAAGFELIDSDY